MKGARELVAQQSGPAGLGPVEVELLLGKVYSQWRGHTTEALVVYDGLQQVCGWVGGAWGGKGCCGVGRA